MTATYHINKEINKRIEVNCPHTSFNNIETIDQWGVHNKLDLLTMGVGFSLKQKNNMQEIMIFDYVQKSGYLFWPSLL